MKIVYTLNKAELERIAEHLTRCNSHFIPTLSSKVNIMEYAQKVCLHAVRFEAWKGDQLVGLVAVYMNDEGKEKAFVTNVSVVHEYVGRGIASLLIEQAMLEAKQQKLKKIILEVSANNPAAVSLYRKMNFVVDKQDESSTLTMSKYL